MNGRLRFHQFKGKGRIGTKRLSPPQKFLHRNIPLKECIVLIPCTVVVMDVEMADPGSTVLQPVQGRNIGVSIHMTFISQSARI